MLMRTDPFRELDRLAQQVFGNPPGTWNKPTAMPMDAYRAGDEFVMAFDLPGMSPDDIELAVERNVLTVKAERRSTAAGENVEMQVAERPLGVFSRQLFLGEALDTEHISASYDAGVLTLRIPVAEQAKPRRIAVSAAEGEQQQINARPARSGGPRHDRRIRTRTYRNEQPAGRPRRGRLRGPGPARA
jgi:HSP20 family protein